MEANKNKKDNQGKEIWTGRVSILVLCYRDKTKGRQSEWRSEFACFTFGRGEQRL